MADIASLGIRVTTQGAKEAAADLDKLKASGEKAAQSFSAPGKGVAPAMDKAALSAKQLAFATRGLPAQFTDIAVALQSGQRPLTILLQQGGQIKDVFGGVGPAIRAMGGYIAGLVNPLTITAAAVAALGLAWKEADDRASGFNRALALSGLSADLTSEKLAAMATQIDKTTGVTAGKASEVLAQVVATGKFTADQIDLVARAAINLEDATGRSIEQTVKEFASLKGDPVDAILALNDAMGDGTNVTQFLTQEQIRSIEKLKEQGRQADATAEAMRDYAEAINSRAPKVVDNLGFFATAWRNISKAARETGDEAVNAIGRIDKSLLDSLPTLQKYIAALPGGSVLGPLVAAVGAGQGRRGFDAGGVNVRGAVGQLGFDATAPFNPNGRNPVNGRDERAALELKDRYLTQEERKKKAIAELDRLRSKYTTEEYNAIKAGIEEQFKAPRTGGGSSRRAGSSVRALPDFSKNAGEDLARLAEQEDRATQSFLDMAATLSGPLAEAQRDHEKRVQELNALAQQSPIAAQGLSAALDNEASRYAKVTEEIERQMDPMGQLLDDMKFELDMIGKSNGERAVMNELRRAGIDLMGPEAQGALAVARAYEDEAAAKQRSIDLMDDFRRGAADALTDFVTGAKSAKDALKDFFDEMAAQITKAIANKWIEQLFGKQGSDGAGTSGGGWIATIASLFASANGNAFVNGTPVQAFASGGVFDKPTMFGMAGGRLGVMGEAGPEAILPLHRGPDGKLGVRMEAANDSQRIVNNVTTFVLPQTTTPQTQAQIAQNQQRAATRATSRNR